MTKVLSPTELQLLSLVTTERSGRQVAQLYEKETGGSISYGTLYTTFRRLKEHGWVRVRDAHDDDGRLRFFLITGRGARMVDRAREYYDGLARFGHRLAMVRTL